MLKARADVQSENEIDLVALVVDMWAQKFLIIGIAVIVAGLAFCYAYVTTSIPIYEAKLYILPPTQSAIAGFNAGRSKKDPDLKPYTIQDVYTVFTKNLEKESLRQVFFKEVYLPSLSEDSRRGSVDQLYSVFSQQLLVSADKGNPVRYLVAFQNQNATKAAEWVKAYVDRANEIAKSELILNILEESSVRANYLEKNITGLRSAALLARNDRIFQLSEALRIAETIGLTNPQSSSITVISTDKVVDNSLAYLRGTKALKAEIEILQSRTSDDAFIPNLRKLQAKYNYFNKVSVDPASVSVSSQDGNVEIPDAPLKTKKRFIVLAGIFVGFALGIFVALVRILILRYAPARKLEV